MSEASEGIRWHPPTCGYRLQHLKSCRVAGGHAASLAGAVSKGGGSKVDASRSVDGYLGVGEFSGHLEASTGFVCDRNLTVRGPHAAALVTRKRTRMPACMPLQVIEQLRVGDQAWENTGINHAFKAVDAVQRKVAPALKRAQQFGAHSSAHVPRSSSLTSHRCWCAGLQAWNALSPEEKSKHGWDCSACASCPVALRFFGKAIRGECTRVFSHLARASFFFILPCVPNVEIDPPFRRHRPQSERNDRKKLPRSATRAS